MAAGWALMVVTATAGVGGADFAPLPLSAEDLALLAGDDDVDTSSASEDAGAAPLEAWNGPLGTLEHRRVFQALGRSVGEGLVGAPTWAGLRRLAAAGESIQLRGLGGYRVPVRLDGISMHHALTPMANADDWFVIDPAAVGAIDVGRDSVDLYSAALPEGRRTRAVLLGRTADRSSGVQVAVGDTRGPASINLRGGYHDLARLRLAGTAIEVPSGFQRTGGGGRVRLFGREGDRGHLEMGFDHDRVINHEVGALLEPSRVRELAFIRGGVEGEAWSTSATLYRHTFSRRIAELDVQVHTLGADAQVRHRIGDLQLKLQAASWRSRSIAQFPGSVTRLDAAAGGELDLGVLHLDAMVGYGAGETKYLDRAANAGAVQVDATARVDLFDGVHLLAGFDRRTTLPSVLDLGANAQRAEVQSTVSGGPELRFARVEADLDVFFTRLDRPIITTGDSRDRLDVFGVQARGRWVAGHGFSVLSALSVRRADAVLESGETLRLGVRYDVQGHDAFAQALLWVARTDATDGVVLGRLTLSGGVDLGAGFYLNAVVDNATDSNTADDPRLLVQPGVDLRLALSHTW